MPFGFLEILYFLEGCCWLDDKIFVKMSQILDIIALVKDKVDVDLTARWLNES